MIKIIISSVHLLKVLKSLSLGDPVEFNCDDNKLTIHGIEIGCVCNGVGLFDVRKERVERLIKLLPFFSDQPLTIGLDTDGWIFIKEAIV